MVVVIESIEERKSIEKKMFHILKKRLKFKGTVIAESGLHIGTVSSNEIIGTDSPVIKDFYGRPYIPGSSFKGVLRSAVEKIVNGLANKDFYCCDIMNDPCADRIRKEIKTKEEAGIKKYEEFDRARDYITKSCQGCLLFGSLGMASKIMIKDLPVKNPDLWLNQFEVRDGVAIERDTETARDTGKFDYEIVPKGTMFDLEIIMENPEDYQIGLFLVGIREMGEGFALLGGNTSRGLGRVKIEWEEIIEQDAPHIIKNDGTRYIKIEKKEEVKKEELPVQKIDIKKKTLVKPKTDDKFLWLAYAIKKLEEEGKKTEGSSINDILTKEFDFDKNKRKEMHLPEKLSDFIRIFENEKKISKWQQQYRLEVDVNFSSWEISCIDKFIEDSLESLVKELKGGKSDA
jgi:CRISPR-associated RAMP protein (TIGR02581 family)